MHVEYPMGSHIRLWGRGKLSPHVTILNRCDNIISKPQPPQHAAETEWEKYRSKSPQLEAVDLSRDSNIF